MALETTTDRTSIPKLDSDLINAGQLQLAKISAPLVTAIVAVLAGVLPNTGLGSIPKLSDLDKSQQGVVIFGILFVIGLSVSYREHRASRSDSSVCGIARLRIQDWNCARESVWKLIPPVN